MIAQDIQKRLQAALGPDVPVLLPDQIDLPKQGRTPGQPGGIPAYLAQHQEGYVQIETPVPISSDGTTALYWVVVASICPDALACADLGFSVWLALNGLPHDPGPHREVTPAQPTPLQPGVWIARPTYDAVTVVGQSAATQE